MSETRVQDRLSALQKMTTSELRNTWHRLLARSHDHPTASGYRGALPGRFRSSSSEVSPKWREPASKSSRPRHSSGCPLVGRGRSPPLRADPPVSSPAATEVGPSPLPCARKDLNSEGKSTGP